MVRRPGCRPGLGGSGAARPSGHSALSTRVPNPRRRGDPGARGLPGRVLPDDRGARGGEDGVLGWGDA